MALTPAILEIGTGIDVLSYMDRTTPAQRAGLSGTGRRYVPGASRTTVSKDPSMFHMKVTGFSELSFRLTRQEHQDDLSTSLVAIPNPDKGRLDTAKIEAILTPALVGTGSTFTDRTTLAQRAGLSGAVHHSTCSWGT